MKQKKRLDAAKKAASAKKTAPAKQTASVKSNGQQKNSGKQQVVVKKVNSSNGSQPKVQKPSKPKAKATAVDPKKITIKVQNTNAKKVAKPVQQLDPHQIVFQVETGRKPPMVVKKTPEDARRKRVADNNRNIQAKREAIITNNRNTQKAPAPTSLSERFSRAAGH